MRSLERVTLVVQAADLRPQLPGVVPAREFFQIDRFAEELQPHVTAPVDVFEGAVENAPGGGMLIVIQPPPPDERWRELPRPDLPAGPRPLLLGASPGNISELALSTSPAGVVGSDRFGYWRVRAEERTRRQMHGLVALEAVLTPLLVAEHDEEQGGYCLYSNPAPLSLPLVVARYIQAYWQSL